MEPIKIRSANLIKEFGQNRAVDNVSIDVSTGEVVGLLGPNGAGKTTTFKMIVGFERPTQGQIFFGPTDVTRFPLHKRAKLGMGYLPQEQSVFRKMTVRDNLKAILQARGISKAETRERIEQVEEELGIEHLRRRRAEVLSGGEKRRVEIARALTLKPKFLLLDEPFAGVDPKTVEDIMEIIGKLRERGLGILITDHNVRETLQITDRSYILTKGVVMASGTVKEILANPEIRRAYITDRIARDIEAGAAEREKKNGEDDVVSA